MEFVIINLENELVTLTPLKETDFERLFSVASDPQIWEQHPTRYRYKRDVFKLYFDGAVNSGTAYLIFERDSGHLIGCTRFYNYDPEHSKVAIGYTFLAKAYWGGIYNKSVKLLLIKYAYQYVETILFHVAADNIRSQKAVLKLGANKIAEIDFEHYGTYVPHFEYELTRQAD